MENKEPNDIFEDDVSIDELVAKMEAVMGISDSGSVKKDEANSSGEPAHTDVPEIEGIDEIAEMVDVDEMKHETDEGTVKQDGTDTDETELDETDAVIYVDDVSPEMQEQYVSDRIRNLVKELSADSRTDDDAQSHASSVSNETDEEVCVRDEPDRLTDTVVFDVKEPDTESTSCFDSAHFTGKIYHFRRVSGPAAVDDDPEVTKVIDAPKDGAYEDETYEPSEKSDKEQMEAAFRTEEETTADEEPVLDRPDLHVMMTFGASIERVKDLYGEDIAEEYEQMLANPEGPKRQADDNEYVSDEQKNEILFRFKRKMLALRTRITVCTVICLLILIYENLGAVKLHHIGIFNPSAYPVSHIMFDLQLLVFAAVAAFPILRDGFSDLAAFEPTGKSISLLMTVVAVLVNIASCFAGGTVVLYNLIAAVSLLFSLIAEAKNWKHSYMAFRIISADRPKATAVSFTGTAKSPEVLAFEELDEDDVAKIIRVQKTHFVKNFFSRIHEPDSTVHDKVIFPLTAAVMVILFVLAWVLHDSASFALRISAMAFSVIVPISVYFSQIIPTGKAAKYAYESGSAIIGTAALEEYSGASIIAFEDKDVFPSYSVKLSSVKVFGDARIDRVLSQASAVFSRLGGPLMDVFSVVTTEIAKSDDIEILSVAKDGIEATVDGAHILLGKAEYLAEHGIYPKNEESDDTNAECSRMYLAEGDVLCAKFYIRYHVDVDFGNIISRMETYGICAVVKTMDPNIDDALLSRFVHSKKMQIHVLKCKKGEDLSTLSEELDSGIVSTGNAKNIVDTVITCERLYDIRRSGNTVKLVAMIIGIILGVLLAVFGISPFHSIFVLLYQLLWIIPALVSGRVCL